MCKGYFLEIDVQYHENLHERHNDLPFLYERIKLKKIGKLITIFHEKVRYVIHIGNLKQVLNHELVSKKDQRVIKLNQKAWLKAYILIIK